jgi:hypothetical protein
MSRLDELKRKAAEMTAEIERLEREEAEAAKPKGPWSPEKGQEYWFNWNDGNVLSDTYQGYKIHSDRKEIGNCHRTKELAKAASLRRQAIEAKKYSYAEAQAMAERGELYFVCYGKDGRFCVPITPHALSKTAYNYALCFGTKKECEAWLESDQCKAFDVVDEG